MNPHPIIKLETRPKSAAISWRAQDGTEASMAINPATSCSLLQQAAEAACRAHPGTVPVLVECVESLVLDTLPAAILRHLAAEAPIEQDREAFRIPGSIFPIWAFIKPDGSAEVRAIWWQKPVEIKTAHGRCAYLLDLTVDDPAPVSAGHVPQSVLRAPAKELPAAFAEWFWTKANPALARPYANADGLTPEEGARLDWSAGSEERLMGLVEGLALIRSDIMGLAAQRDGILVRAACPQGRWKASILERDINRLEPESAELLMRAIAENEPVGEMVSYWSARPEGINRSELHLSLKLRDLTGHEALHLAEAAEAWRAAKAA